MAGDLRDDRGFLRRWSQRKLAAARPATSQTPEAPAATVASASAATGGPSPHPAAATGTLPPQEPAPARGTPRDEAPELPPIESLRFDSDFTRFLAPKVDEAVKRKALRKLFSDPSFNVMDGLDVYIDDYSKSEPIPADLVAKLRHARYIFDPPKTQVNEAGHVEDVPDEAKVVASAAAPDPAVAGGSPGEADGSAQDVARGADEAATTEAAPAGAGDLADPGPVSVDVPALDVPAVSADRHGKR